MVTEQLGMQKAEHLPFTMTMTKSNLHMVPSRQLPRMPQTRVPAKLTIQDPYCSLPVILNQLSFKLLADSFCLCKQAAKTHLQSVPSSLDHSHQCWVSHIVLGIPSTLVVALNHSACSMSASISPHEGISKVARRVSGKQGQKQVDLLPQGLMKGRSTQ